MKYTNQDKFRNITLFKKMAFFLVYSKYVGNRKAIAEMSYRLDILVNDPDPDIRVQVAKQGYKSDILVNDPIWRVRHKLASQGYELDKLINDPDPHVRKRAKRKLNEIRK